ncbi:hypothetical protein B0T10DRAFT_483744 [Thelonectria olida]|uniref:Uncharacterized protein n=1 Tax=Thelonectria olida TaxID=1576542 RepID=A0A9P8WAH5_9HYPO|nr:hypothetical protein B0T10DRAFT_483744 [Thelonectria olida]
MASRSFSVGKVAVSLALAAGGTYGFLVYRRTRATDSKRIQRFDRIPDAFRQSPTITKIVNVKNHAAIGDSRFIAIDIPSQHQHLSDETLLAKFVQGFFGGVVISPERMTLQTLGLNLVHFSQAQIPAKAPSPIWRKNQLSDTALPPLHSVLYGVFQVLDLQLTTEDDSEGRKGDTESHIDFGFGSDQVGFAGAHRFSVVRPKKDPNSDVETVQIHYHSTACNPKTNKPMGPAFMFRFHEAYGEFLFREGIAEVVSYIQGA